MEPLKKLPRGTQIAYIPTHAQEWAKQVQQDPLKHRDVEFGFITSVGDKFVFCRFWYKSDLTRLRTKANSEAVSPEDLTFYQSVPELRVRSALEEYC